MVLPIVFVLRRSRGFPAGLLLYWVTTNLWTVGQGLVTRRLVPKTSAPAAEALVADAAEGRWPATAMAETAAEGGAPRRRQPVAAAPRRVKRKKKKGGRR